MKLEFVYMAIALILFVVGVWVGLDQEHPFTAKQFCEGEKNITMYQKEGDKVAIACVNGSQAIIVKGKYL